MFGLPDAMFSFVEAVSRFLSFAPPSSLASFWQSVSTVAPLMPSHEHAAFSRVACQYERTHKLIHALRSAMTANSLQECLAGVGCARVCVCVVVVVVVVGSYCV